MTISFEKLNRRHKAALFLTLLIAGLTLIFSESVRIALGVTLVCLALTWAFGSNSRLVHYAFLVVGLLLSLGPLVERGLEWRSYRNRAADFERRIPELANSYPVPESGQWITVTTVGQLEQVLRKISLEEASGQELLRRIESIETLAPKLRASIAFAVERAPQELDFRISRSSEEEGDQEVPEFTDLPTGTRRVVAVPGPSKGRGIWIEVFDEERLLTHSFREEVPDEVIESTIVRLRDPRLTPRPTLGQQLEELRRREAQQQTPPPSVKVRESRILIDVSPITKPSGTETPYGVAVFPEVLPNWYLDAIVAGVDLLQVFGSEPKLLPESVAPVEEPKTLTLKGYAEDNVVLVVPGLLLTCMGLGLLLGVKPRRNPAQI